MTPAVRRRTTVRSARRRRVARTPPAARPARRTSRTLRIVTVAAAALLLVWWLTRDDPAEPPPPEPEHAAAPAMTRPAHHAAKKPPKPAPPVSTAVDEARLRAALQERAPDLRACSIPPGAPPQVPTRLRVAADGKTRTVELTSPVPIPAPLAACLRERMSAWRFDELQLQSELAVLVTFALR